MNLKQRLIVIIFSIICFILNVTLVLNASTQDIQTIADSVCKKIAKKTAPPGEVHTRNSFNYNSTWNWSTPKDQFIKFSEYKGDLTTALTPNTPKDRKRIHTWTKPAMGFFQEVMQLIPPAMRDTIIAPYIEACDVVADEIDIKNGYPIPTQNIDITIAACTFYSLAKNCRMPESVLNNLAPVISAASKDDEDPRKLNSIKTIIKDSYSLVPETEMRPEYQSR